MADIKGQLIKNSYNYVLQSDLITGIVYRIGGDVPANPKFISGLTINSSFTYSDGSELAGYVLTCDASGNATWAPASATTSSIFVTGGTFDYTTGNLELRNSNGSSVNISGLTDTYITGGTISGTSVTFTYNDGDTFELTGITPYSLFSSYTASTQVTIDNKLDTSGFTAYTATTQPLILNSVTGGTYSGGTLYLTNNSGSTIPITGFTTSSTGDYLPLSGGTVTGDTIFQSGLTANTISATTYYNLPVSAVTNGFGISASTGNGTVTITNTAPDQIVTISGGTGITTGGTYPNFTLINSSPDQTVIITGGTNIQITGTYPSFGVNFTGSTSSTGDYLPLSGGTVTGGTNFTNGLTANTISATTYLNLPVDVFVTGGTYTSGNAIFTNNTGGTFTVSGFNTGGGGGQIFYLNISQSKNGNRYLSTTASTAAEQSTGVTIADGVTSTIASFQSDQLNITLIPGGVWAFYLHSYKSNTNASFNIFVEVYKRTSGGTETLLFTTDPTAVTSNSPNPSMQLSDAYFSGSSILVSDSIVAVVRATNTSNQSHVITLFSEGTQHYSYAVSSIPTQQGLTCDTLSGCSIIQTIQGDITTIQGDITTISGNVETIFSSITGTPQQIAYYNADGNLTGDTSFTRQDETNNYQTYIGTINSLNVNEYQQSSYDYYRVRSRVFNDDISLVGVTRLESQSFLSKVENTTGGTISSLEILETSGSFTYQDSGGTCGFFYNSTNPGWSVVKSVTQYDYNLPQSAYLAGGVLTDVSGDGNLTWVIPTSSTFTGGTVSGSTNFTGGLTANTISATTYQNLPATPFLPLTGGTVNGNVNIVGTIDRPFQVTASNSGTSYGIYSYATQGTNAYGVYGVASPEAFPASIINGIGGYFAADNSNGEGNPTNRYSVQLVDGTQGVNKVLTSVTSDGKANWSDTLNVSAVTATTITSNSVKVLPVELTVVSNTASTDASLSSLFTLTLTGNTTLATPTNGFSGQRIVYRLRQDGTGNKLLTLSSGFRSGPITVTLSTAANTTDYLGVIYNEIDNEWDVLALNKGYS